MLKTECCLLQSIQPSSQPPSDWNPQLTLLFLQLHPVPSPVRPLSLERAACPRCAVDSRMILPAESPSPFYTHLYACSLGAELLSPLWSRGAHLVVRCSTCDLFLFLCGIVYAQRKAQILKHTVWWVLTNAPVHVTCMSIKIENIPMGPFPSISSQAQVTSDLLFAPTDEFHCSAASWMRGPDDLIMLSIFPTYWPFINLFLWSAFSFFKKLFF